MSTILGTRANSVLAIGETVRQLHELAGREGGAALWAVMPCLS